MTFDQARQQKFEAGAKEHQQPWNKEHIDHLKEIQDELLDLANYSSLDLDDPLMHQIHTLARQLWNDIESRK